MPKSEKESIRIVVVDDHALFREGLRMLIENYPNLALVGEAGNLSEALAIIVREQPDLVLLDLDLGGENGLDLIEKARSAGRSARFLVLTGIREEQLHRRAMRMGAMGVVKKESAGRTLAKAIEKVHAGEIWLERTMIADVLAEEQRERNPQPADPIKQRIDELTDREREIVALVAEGFGTQQLADRLYISVKTVRNHLASIYAKLGVSDRLDLALFVMRHGLGGAPKRL